MSSTREVLIALKPTGTTAGHRLRLRQIGRSVSRPLFYDADALGRSGAIQLGRSGAIQLGYVLRYYYSGEDIQSNSFQNTHPEVSSARVLGGPKPDALEILRHSYKNLVYSGLDELKADFDQVLCSDYKPACMCAEYLISLGQTKICYLGETAIEQRYQGLCDTMKKYGISDHANYMIETPLTLAGGYDSINAL